MTAPPLPVLARFRLAWVCFYRVLFSEAYARRVRELEGMAALPAPAPPDPDEPPVPKVVVRALRSLADTVPSAMAPLGLADRDLTPALQLLALLQREGRLVDFAEQDVASFSDADVGAAARVVHEGVRKVLDAHFTVAPLRTEAEGGPMTVPAGYEPAAFKLVGDVKGGGPYRGTLRHKGWRATRVTLPQPVDGHDATVLAPAEIEL